MQAINAPHFPDTFEYQDRQAGQQAEAEQTNVKLGSIVVHEFHS